ncbi:odorant receptor 131-2 [Takifugu rubripes]|uniref:odorant receptor 131-2 n=1 Tax=Takifugu rubripes TaxID=31033 RepID=UPI000298A76F|nr:odorant receptor 131-2 [Takifugu rubripes]XP_056910315.1 odorant receptor 131-2-like [Takifugu flavidus]|eukprot:XP_003976253.1 PREDICTED: olfactory receptor 2A12-like [Takifugu rubripes]
MDEIQSLVNVTIEQQYSGLLERMMFFSLTSVPCCVFLYINGIMLFSLKSKTVFCETSRYILLFNLLFADSIQMALSQVLYILAACLIKMSYPVCGILSVVGVLTSDISPLTLVVMSLERYVAVCYPLRHADVITIRNTVLMIFVIWAFSLLSGLIRVSLVDYPELESLQMEEFCSSITLFVGPLSDTYDKANTCFLFVSAGLAIAFSYIGVTVAARSASTDKTSAQKARNTLLLHLVQLGLSLSSTVYKPVLTALSRIVTRIVLIRVQIVLYVWFFILPRCLSALIYGIRDQLIRPVLFYHLCCRLKLSVLPGKGYK